MSVTNTNENTSAQSIGHNTIRQGDMSLTYRVATLQDCESLVLLINSASRGEFARQGWTSDDWLLEGPRLDVQMLTDIIDNQTNVILMFSELNNGTLVGCVLLEHNSAANAAHFALFAVRPNLQRKGYGKLIISVAENYAINHWNVKYIEMKVINLRSELIAYYNRRGYVDTGRRKPFPSTILELVFPREQIWNFVC